jgi:hypothetical protein
MLQTWFLEYRMMDEVRKPNNSQCFKSYYVLSFSNKLEIVHNTTIKKYFEL